MAGSSLLEREIEKITGETQEQKASQESMEAAEHRQKMGENLRNLLDRNVDYRNDSEEYVGPEHVYNYADYGVGEHAPAVPNSPSAPSATSRIQDYLAANRNIEEMRARSSEKAPTLQDDVFARAMREVFPQSYAAVAPSDGGDGGDYYEPSEEEELYRQGIFMNAEFASEKEYQMPAYSPSYMAAPTMPVEEGEDARPTPKTMGIIEDGKRAENMEHVQSGFSAKAKIILAALAATIAILVAIISINTAVLNTARARVREREGELLNLTETLTGIQGEIDSLTSLENVENWAGSHGMTPPEN